MNQAININELKTCLACKFRRETPAKFCPKCKRRLWTPNGVRVVGVLQIGLGILIAGFAFLILLIANYGPQRPNSQDRTFLIICGMMVVIGGSFFECISGSWKLLTGKSNPKLMSGVLTIGIFILIFITAYVEFYRI